tara:strand:- start:10397 stop:11041 length:645 start_codon:yes stop_codon:yes gene_type:complete
MQVILLERIAKLGQIGDVVSVKDGYARNFLLPQNKALRATKANLDYFEAQRKEIEARNLEAKKEAEAVAAKMDNVSAIIIRSAGDSGQLYGSVSSRDIAAALLEQGYQVNRNQIVLDRAIKSIGIYAIEIRLHPEVSVTVSINVARSKDEAEIQAKGEEVRAREAAEEISVEDYFEKPEEVIEELSGEATEEASEPEAETEAEATETEEENKSE